MKYDGSVVRYKAKLVAKGYIQQHGIDYVEIFSPVAKMSTIRLGVTAARGWILHQLNVNIVFLYSDLYEEVYMHPPLGYNVTTGHVYKLNR